MDTYRCSRCGRQVPPHDGVHRSDGKGGNLGFVCGRCWTQIISEHTGREISHLEVAPVVLEDPQGRDHEFHFRFNPMPRHLEAFEVTGEAPSGYEFAVLAEEDESNVALVGRLLAKIRDGLARQHLKHSDLTGGLMINGMVVRGRIESDLERDRTPYVVIDGKAIPWSEFGSLLLQFEGWQFRIDLIDFTDEP